LFGSKRWQNDEIGKMQQGRLKSVWHRKRLEIHIDMQKVFWEFAQWIFRMQFSQPVWSDQQCLW